MCTEIEAKFKVDSHKEIVTKLTELGAEFLEEQLQKDCYFDDMDASFRKGDRCLRLRCQLTAEGERALLTYKGAKKKDNFKKRQEIEIDVGDAGSSVKLLSALGYEKSFIFEKKRQLWRLGNCKVCLDTLPSLGDFVEVEGPEDKDIANVQKSLGLADLPHIPESYAFLMEKKLRQQKA